MYIIFVVLRKLGWCSDQWYKRNYYGKMRASYMKQNLENKKYKVDRKNRYLLTKLAETRIYTDLQYTKD